MLIMNETFKSSKFWTFTYPGINLGGIKVALFVVIKVPDDRDMMDI